MTWNLPKRLWKAWNMIGWISSFMFLIMLLYEILASGWYLGESSQYIGIQIIEPSPIIAGAETILLIVAILWLLSFAITGLPKILR